MVLPDAGRVSPGALACSLYIDVEMGEVDLADHVNH
jgi:hypothetical protein